MAKIIIFGLIFATNIETIKCQPKMIYLSAPGAYWNEYCKFSLPYSLQ